MAPEGKSGVAMAGTTLSVTGPDTTISGTVISAAPSGLIIAGETLTLPTPSPGATGDAVIIAGSTVTAGGSPATIAGIPLSLATGPSGLYVSAQSSGSVTPSASVLAGESVSLGPAGQLVVGGSPVTAATGDGSGGLGSVIMAGFGPASSMAGTDLGNGHATGGGGGNATVGVLGFAGGARRLAGMGAMSIMVQLSVLWWLGS